MTVPDMSTCPRACKKCLMSFLVMHVPTPADGMAAPTASLRGEGRQALDRQTTFLTLIGNRSPSGVERLAPHPDELHTARQGNGFRR